jgi:biphenyl-2,3-diol 1,2-dioxygenase
MTVSALGYLGFGVTDVEKWLKFSENVIGFEVTETGEDGTVYLRMDELHHRIALHPGGNDDLAYIGMQTRNKDEFEETKKDLFEIGVEFVQGSPAEIENRKVRDMIKFNASGVPMEVFYGPKVLFERPFKSPLRITGFKTGDIGMGHLGVTADDNDEMARILHDGLGMKVSDALGGGERFFHCAGNAAREHTFVLGRPGMPGADKRIGHFMVELNSLDDVGSGLDRVEDYGVQLSSRLGKHTNDHMISFYMYTPSGFRMEYGWNGRLVNDETWNVQIYDKASIWGHRAATKAPEPTAAEPIVTTPVTPAR